MINVYVISGFLGSGKTTLIQKLINDKVFVKPMLIENEFGEVGIDDLLLKDSLEVIGINSGCICCSLKGDLKKALDTIKSYDIDSLIIEPSGVGKLSEINKTIVADKDLKLVFDVAMVDAKKALSYHRNFKEFFDDQIIMADTIVLSKTEDLDEVHVFNEIRKETGISPVHLGYVPKEMRLIEYELNKEINRAVLLYDYNGQIIQYSMYMNDVDSSYGQIEMDQLIDEYEIVLENDTHVDIKEYEVPNKEGYRYVAEFQYYDVRYQLIGIMEKSEFEKIINNLSFFE